MPATLFVVATPIGNLDDISARALRVLREVAVIAAEDTRHTARLLARYAITTPTTSLHEHNETAKAPELLDRLKRGDSVAIVSDAGSPTISDPGQRLVHAALEAGVRVEPVPGPSAVIAALAASGFPAGTFTFLGFPPVRSSDRTKWLEELRTAGRTVVFFEAPHRIRDTLADLQRVLGGTARACVGREMTKAHEELVVSPIADLIDRWPTPKGEFTVVIDVGAIDRIDSTGPPASDVMVAEVEQMTENAGSSRRKAVSAVARKYRIAPNELYRLVEEHRKSVK